MQLHRAVVVAADGAVDEVASQTRVLMLNDADADADVGVGVGVDVVVWLMRVRMLMDC